MTTLRGVITRHPLPIYFALAFTLSWGAILILVGPNGIPATADHAVVLGVAMLIGPSVAGILLTVLKSGRTGFREFSSRLFRWKVSAGQYAVALLTYPLLTTAVLLALSLFSSVFAPSLSISDAKAALVVNGILAGLMVGFFEELGWTGFAIPQMRLRYGILASGISLGVLWGAWHFLLFWEKDSFSGAFPLALLLVRLFSWTPAYRVLMAWVYDRSESLLVAMVMHVSLVATTVIIDPALTGGALFTFLLVRAAVLWALVAVVAAVQRRKLLVVQGESLA